MKRWLLYTVIFLLLVAAKKYFQWPGFEADETILQGTFWMLLAVALTWIVSWVIFVARKG